MENSAILLVHCPDQRGLVAAVSTFLYDHHGNILHADHHQDSTVGLFLMRVEWDLRGFSLDLEQCARLFDALVHLLTLRWCCNVPREVFEIETDPAKNHHCLAD